MAKTTTIAGNTFLFTGKLTEFTREDAEAHVEAEGGKVLSGVSAKLNYLVVGEDAGSKLAKVEALGTVTILHEKEFLKIMSSGKKAPGKSATNKATTKDNAIPAAAKTAYEEVQIGKQIWMAKNLDVTHFRNGDPIPEARTNKEWEKAGDDSQPAWCFYDNKDSNGKQYGKLYNWHAVNDSRCLAPEGFKIPSDNVWIVLTDHLGGESVAGKKMKFTSQWEFGRVRGNGTNESGFGGLPGSQRYNFGDFKDQSHGKFGSWWCSSEHDQYDAWARHLFYDKDSVFKGYSSKEAGLSVRCIKDESGEASVAKNKQTNEKQTNENKLISFKIKFHVYGYGGENCITELDKKQITFWKKKYKEDSQEAKSSLEDHLWSYKQDDELPPTHFGKWNDQDSILHAERATYSDASRLNISVYKEDKEIESFEIAVTDNKIRKEFFDEFVPNKKKEKGTAYLYSHSSDRGSYCNGEYILPEGKTFDLSKLTLLCGKLFNDYFIWELSYDNEILEDEGCSDSKGKGFEAEIYFY